MIESAHAKPRGTIHVAHRKSQIASRDHGRALANCHLDVGGREPIGTSFDGCPHISVADGVVGVDDIGEE
jgi:hypothetical protein